VRLSSRFRRAVTLVELLVALAVTAVVGTLATAAVVRQMRAGAAVAERTELRDQLLEGAAILAADISSISSAGGDVFAGEMSAQQLGFLSTYGSSAICTIPGANVVVLPPSAPALNGVNLTHARQRVEPGHGMYLFDEGEGPEPDDDSWVLRAVTAVTTVVGGCGGSPLVAAADVNLATFRITLDAPLPATVSIGAPVRMVQRVRYVLYQSSDSKWYLGFCASASLTSTCSSVQPLSGPYSRLLALPAAGQSGLDLSYYNEAGAPTSDRTSVALVEITLRGAPQGGFNSAGSRVSMQSIDSVRAAAVVRNR
jgi:prepilin-type N-terminal cleavage/methylation domain-containing protein